MDNMVSGKTLSGILTTNNWWTVTLNGGTESEALFQPVGEDGNVHLTAGGRDRGEEVWTSSQKFWEDFSSQIGEGDVVTLTVPGLKARDFVLGEVDDLPDGWNEVRAPSDRW